MALLDGASLMEQCLVPVLQSQRHSQSSGQSSVFEHLLWVIVSGDEALMHVWVLVPQTSGNMQVRSPHFSPTSLENCSTHIPSTQSSPSPQGNVAEQFSPRTGRSTQRLLLVSHTSGTRQDALVQSSPITKPAFWHTPLTHESDPKQRFPPLHEYPSRESSCWQKQVSHCAFQGIVNHLNTHSAFTLEAITTTDDKVVWVALLVNSALCPETFGWGALLFTTACVRDNTHITWCSTTWAAFLACCPETSATVSHSTGTTTSALCISKNRGGWCHLWQRIIPKEEVRFLDVQPWLSSNTLTEHSATPEKQHSNKQWLHFTVKICKKENQPPFSLMRNAQEKHKGKKEAANTMKETIIRHQQKYK